MATIQLKNDANPEEVSAALQAQGITMGQQLEDGRYVVYVNQENLEDVIKIYTGRVGPQRNKNKP